MGNLTTLTIYNDGIDLIPQHAQEFADALLETSRSMTGPTEIRVGNFCNLVKVQVPRHADTHTAYVHMGNTVCEMHPYSRETQRIMRESPVFFEKMLEFMRVQVKDLSVEFKRVQEEKATV